MRTEVGTAQAGYGFTCLGPIVASFLHDLDGVLERLVAQRGGRALYVARGGLLIQHALNVYREAIDAHPRGSEAPLYASRFIAAKGAWLKAPERALAVLDREFGVATGEEYLRRLDPEAQIEPKEGATFTSFSEFLKLDGALQQQCRLHLTSQAGLIGRYFAGLCEDHPVIALIDTGWQGTIQSLFTHSHPGRELWGVNFGRYGEIDPAISQRLLGLVFQGDYDPDKPLSAIAHHRHLIEALFEPVGASVESVVEKNGEVRPVGIGAFTSPGPQPSEPALFAGVLRYLREVAPTLSYSGLLRERDLAAKQLEQDILYPAFETAKMLGAFTRSIDFGRRDGLPVLLDSAGGQDRPEERIRASLWKQGQVALECRPGIARERQRNMAPRGRCRVTAQTDARKATSPTVAIVMRTMNRLAFLQRALEGIARQTFEDYVLVVFNDGGDVAGVEAELELSRVDRRKVVLLDGGENRGMEAASNAAIQHVDSEYIVIHDDDDSWVVNFLEKTVQFLDANPAATGVVTRSYYIEDEICGDQILLKHKKHYNPWLNAVQLGELLAGNFYPPISFLFRRSHYEAVGGFDETLPVLGDWLFNIKMAARGEIGVVPEALANYHHRSAAGGYANSIVGGSDLHARYNPVVRRKLLEHEGLSAFSGISLLSPLVAEVRTLVRSARGGGSPADKDLAAAADVRWCMLAYAREHPDRAREMTAQEALTFVERRGAPTPPDFDEKVYLEENQDLREFLRKDGALSGFVHFVLYGRREGRRRPTR